MECPWNVREARGRSAVARGRSAVARGVSAVTRGTPWTWPWNAVEVRGHCRGASAAGVRQKDNVHPSFSPVCLYVFMRAYIRHDAWRSVYARTIPATMTILDSLSLG